MPSKKKSVPKPVLPRSKKSVLRSKKSKSKSKAKPVKLVLKGNQHMTGTCMGSDCKRAQRVMVRVVYFKNPNGSIRAAGACDKCGTKMTKFTSRSIFN